MSVRRIERRACSIAGLVAGLAIAMQVGAVSLLLIEASVVGGPRKGVAAGMGVATADFVVRGGGRVWRAARRGGAGGPRDRDQAVAAAVLAAIALHGLFGLWRDPETARAGRGRHRRARTTRASSPSPPSIPSTIASFAAVATALSVDGASDMLAFVLGVGLAAPAGTSCCPSPRATRGAGSPARRALAIGGRVAVLCWRHTWP